MKIEGVLVGDRVVVFNIDQAKHLYSRGFYGKYLGVRKAKQLLIDKPLSLSGFEALYLVEQGVLEVVSSDGESLSKDRLEKVFLNTNMKKYLYIVYKDLRKKGYIVKSGLKFGAHFAVYRYGPGIDHAPFLIHVLEKEKNLDPIEIIRAGRLSHSVKKRFILATVRNGKPVYYGFVWFEAVR